MLDTMTIHLNVTQPFKIINYTVVNCSCLSPIQLYKNYFISYGPLLFDLSRNGQLFLKQILQNKSYLGHAIHHLYDDFRHFLYIQKSIICFEKKNSNNLSCLHTKQVATSTVDSWNASRELRHPNKPRHSSIGIINLSITHY